MSRVLASLQAIGAAIQEGATIVSYFICAWIARCVKRTRDDGMCVMTILITSLLLASCGFKPIYGENHKSLPVNVVSIYTVNHEYGKLEYIMRGALEAAFDPTAAHERPEYTMTVRLTKTILSFDTQSNRVSHRQRIDLRADFTLTDCNGKKMLDDFVIASDSFDISISPYSSLISEEESSNLLAKTLAQEIALRVAATLGSR